MNGFARRYGLLLRYGMAGVVSFAVEMSLLYALLQVAVMPYYVSVSVAFLVATILQYEACHFWVFGSSNRRVREEYLYFMTILFSGLLLTLGLVSFFVSIAGVGVLVARLISSVFVSMWDFSMNAVFNFRVHAFLRR